MSRVPSPYDEDSADITLGFFMDNAFNSQSKDIFSKAVNLKHGPFFIVQKDSSQRMYFHCTICNKDMNNVRALTEHSFSGNHIKNKDTELERKNYSAKFVQSYHSSTLQYKIAKSDESTPILGLQRVEGYDSGRGPLYYKCVLCGTHGKADIMYRHLIGDKHTDKYIRTRIVLKNIILTGEERSLLRKRIFAKEKYTEDYIRIIKGKDLFPYRWEEDVWVGKKKFGRDERSRTSPPPSSKERTLKKPKLEVKDEPWEDLPDGPEEDDEEDTRYRNRSPSPHQQGPQECVKVDKSIQSYSFGFLNNILLKLNVIVQAHLVKDTDLHSSKDLNVALSIMRYALHLLFYMYDKSSTLQEGVQKQQKMIVKTCLGYIMKRLIPHFEVHYGKLGY